MVTKANFPILITLFTVIIAGSTSMRGQTFLFDRIQLFNATSNKVTTVAKPANIATSQNFVMPTAIPAEGSSLVISSVNAPTVNLAWEIKPIGSKPPSVRLLADQTAEAPAGLSVGVGANKIYSIQGLLHIKRVSSGSDNLQISVTSPTGTVDSHLTIRCYGCPAGTTLGGTFTSWSSVTEGTTSVTSNVIDPAGSGTADYTSVCTIGVDLEVDTGANAGVVTITATNGGSGTNHVTIGAQSYITSVEVD